ncbi:MAG TPA: hypothetical protein VN764_05725 [Polyangiaceae bacterium]|nr:hypothetical protein [Polyangiaceae bacterium]
MMGFVVAALCAGGLVFMSRRSHLRGYWGMRHVFRRLDTSPGQEKVIRNAIEEMRSLSSEWRTRAQGSRADLAQLIRGRATAAELSTWLGARLSEVNQVTPALAESLGKVHDVLDDRQREMLADLVERGRGFYGYRSGACHHGHC